MPCAVFRNQFAFFIHVLFVFGRGLRIEKLHDGRVGDERHDRFGFIGNELESPYPCHDDENGDSDEVDEVRLPMGEPFQAALHDVVSRFGGLYLASIAALALVTSMLGKIAYAFVYGQHDAVLDCDRHANQRRTALFSIGSRGRSSWFLQKPFTGVSIHRVSAQGGRLRLHSGMLNSWTSCTQPDHPRSTAAASLQRASSAAMS